MYTINGKAAAPSWFWRRFRADLARYGSPSKDLYAMCRRALISGAPVRLYDESKNPIVFEIKGESNHAT